MTASENEKTLLYGVHAIEELVRVSGFYPSDILYCARKKDDARVRPLLHKAKKAGVSLQFVSYSEISALAGSENHQGFLLRRSESFSYPRLEADEISRPGFRLYLALDEVTDPHNLGAIMRSMAAFGAAGLILSRHNSPPLGPTVAKTSAGAMAQIPVLHVSSLANFLHNEQKKGVYVVGSSLEGKKMSAQWAHELRQPEQPVILVLGSEDKGLSRLVQERCDELVFLPQSRAINSLNVSVAAGVFLYEISGRFLP